MTDSESLNLSKNHYTEAEARALIYRYDLPFLIEQEIYPHHQRSSDHQWKLGELHQEWNQLLNNYQIITIKAPRDHLKTFIFSEMFPLREARLNDGIDIRIISGSDDLGISILDNIVRRWLQKPYFKSMLDGADINNKKQIIFANGSRIRAGGYWSAVRGGHPDIIILDDVIDLSVVYSTETNRKSKERLASEIIPMAEPHTKIITIGTIQREDDIYSVNLGDMLGTKKAINKTYDAIVDEEKKITLYPEKWSWEHLMARKREITELNGEKFFLKEYRNVAVNLIGEIIKQEWKKEYTELPNKKLERYTGWDLSVGKNVDSGDFTAKVTFEYDPETRDIYIISPWEERMDFGKRLRAMGNSAELERPLAIAIEDNVFQSDTVQVAKANINTPIKGVTTIMNKTEKYILELAPLFENGKVYLKKGDPMHQKFWEQLTSLPRGKHDDMADAFCNGLRLLPRLRKSSDYIIPR